MAFTTSLATLWSDKVLIQLNKEFVYASNLVCNRDYEGDVSDAYETVKIHGVNRPIVRTYSQDTDIQIDELTDFEAELNLDQADYWAFQVDDIQKIQQVPKLTPQALSLAGVESADKADQYVAGQVFSQATGGSSLDTAVTMPTPLGTSTAPTPISVAAFSDPTAPKQAMLEWLVDLSAQLDQARVPRLDRYVILPPWAIATLTKDLRMSGYEGYSGNTVLNDGFAAQVGQNGFAGRVAGFNVVQSLNVPTGTYTTPTSNSPYAAGAGVSDTLYKIVAGVPSAATFANQIVKTEAYRNPNRFSDVVRGLHTYGFKLIWPERIAPGYIAKGA